MKGPLCSLYELLCYFYQVLNSAFSTAKESRTIITLKVFVLYCFSPVKKLWFFWFGLWMHYFA